MSFRERARARVRGAGARLVEPRHELHHQFLRYVVTGAVASILDLSVLVVLVQLAAMHYLVANIFAFSAGMVVNYALSTRWVFPNRSVKRRSVMISVFLAIGIGGLGINQLCMYAGVDLLGQHYVVTKVLAAFVTLIWNFGMRKLLLFRNGPPPDRP